MNPEEIKVGETYNVRVRISQIHTPSNEIYCCTLAPNGKEVSTASFRITEAAAFSPITPENGIKNTETAPKYDPCRLFKEGDKVREILVKGRRYDARYPECRLGEIATVEEKEDPENLVTIRFANGMNYIYDAAYLELVTPAEELEQEPHFFISDEFEQLPYFCLYFGTKQNQELVARLDKKYYTLEAAEAERDRLNAEYRKEMEK